MSHFYLIVATKEYPTQEVLAKELQPFHEFECTGVDDEYVRDVDLTGEYRREWETGTVFRLRDPDGNLYEPQDDRFLRDPTSEEAEKIGPQTFGGYGSGDGFEWQSRDWGDGRGVRAKVRFVPDGWEQVRVPQKQVQTFTAFVGEKHGLVPHGETPDTSDKLKHKYRYALLDEKGEVVKAVKRTNPDKKWDGWVVGGRYSGRLTSRRGAVKFGEDVVRMGDMDREAMRVERVEGRRHRVESVLVECGLSSDRADELFAQKREASARWEALAEPRPRGEDFHKWCEDNGLPLASVLHSQCFESPDIPAGTTVEQWIESAPFLPTPFAFLREGRWSQMGTMGWFAMVYDAKKQEDWDGEFRALLDAVPDDWYLTAVDCHI